LWEHRQALNYLRAKGIAKKDEAIIFQAINQMREITKESTKNSKSARRQQERLQFIRDLPISSGTTAQAHEDNSMIAPAVPFEDIEIW
jgi:putative transposase